MESQVNLNPGQNLINQQVVMKMLKIGALASQSYKVQVEVNQGASKAIIGHINLDLENLQ